MTVGALHHFVDQEEPARRLATRLDMPVASISVHRFPDGESLVAVEPPGATALVYCSLDRPNERLVDLMLAASALRDGGARRIVLVGPYLCYMRQDTAFHPGEAVSQKAVGAFLSGLADRIVTVDPHLHRTRSLDAVFGGTPAEALSAATLIGETLAAEGLSPEALIAGPDSESRQWVERTAAAAGVGFVVGDKERGGDRSVTIRFADPDAVAGRPVVIVDDLVSSGSTLCTAARRLFDAGAGSVEAIAVHALYGEAEGRTMAEAGIARVRSTDSVAHPSNAIALAPLLAGALSREVSP